MLNFLFRTGLESLRTMQEIHHFVSVIFELYSLDRAVLLKQYEIVDLLLKLCSDINVLDVISMFR